MMTGETVESGVAGPTGEMAQHAALVDTSRVKKWLLQYVDGCRKQAEEVSKNHYWNRIDAENKAYGLHDTALDPQQAGINAASLEQDYEVRTKDLADQVDAMTALLLDLLSSGDIRRLVAKPGITRKQAELTQKVQDSLLNEKDWTGEKRLFVGRFVRNCFAGLKTCRSHEISYITEHVEVPVYLEQPVLDFMGRPVINPQTGQPAVARIPQFTDDALLRKGYSPASLEDGSAIRSEMSLKGLTFVGIADMREDGTYDNILCTRCRETTQDFVYIKAINARRLAIADPTRSIQDQPSIHEYHYLTANELRKCGFANVDELKKSGKPITNTGDQNPGGATTGPNAKGTLKQPVYEIVESWLDIPWEQAANDGEFSEEELRAFAFEQGFPAEEFTYPTYKWQIWHNCDAVLLGAAVTYKMEKDEHVYRGDSFIFGDGEFCGNSQLERISNVAANMLALLNMTVRGIKKNLYQSMLVSDRSQIQHDDMKDLHRPGGFKNVEGMIDFDNDVKIMEVPDISNEGMGIVRYFEGKLSELGVPPILTGEGNADTATQDTINNRRGQTVVNEAFGRMMKVFTDAYGDHLGVMVNSFTVSRYTDIVGEDGQTMTRRWTMPKEITDKLDIVPLIKFDDADKQRATQFLLGMTNIMAPVMGPKVIMAISTLAMEKFGLSSEDIEKIRGSEGDITNVHQEIQAMLQDPDYKVEIRMEDPHRVCIIQAQMAMQQNTQRYQEAGLPVPPMDNLKEYIQMHVGLLQQQQLMAQMQQLQAASGQKEPQGKPKQERSDGGPGDEEGGARQNGQAVGVGNKGPMSAAGLTGQGSVGVM